MKYALDRMLPLNAFQGRGTPVGGRSLRLWGYTEDGTWIPTGDEISDPRLDEIAPEPAYNPPPAAPEPAPWSPPSEPAPEPWSPPPEPAPYNPPPAPAPLAATPAATDWTQTVNDIYQQTLGRQADPSGMATYTSALNAGMTGEQLRAILANSPEGQLMGLSPAPAPVAPLTAAAAAPSDGTYDPNWYANAFPDYVAAQAQDQQAAITGQPSPQAVTPDSVAATYQQLFNAPPPADDFDDDR